MKNRALVAATKGWGRSVHPIQKMPLPVVRNSETTMQAITAQRSAGRREKIA
jgi:hypothetical protein